MSEKWEAERQFGPKYKKTGNGSIGNTGKCEYWKCKHQKNEAKADYYAENIVQGIQVIGCFASNPRIRRLFFPTCKKIVPHGGINPSLANCFL